MIRPPLRPPSIGLMEKSSLETQLKSPLPHGGLTSPTAEVVQTAEGEEDVVEALWDVEDLVVLAATAVEEVVDIPVAVEDSRGLVTGSVQTQLVRT